MVKDINLDDLKILTEDKESYIKQAGIPEKNLFTADNANEIKNKHNALVEYATGFPTEEQIASITSQVIASISDDVKELLNSKEQVYDGTIGDFETKSNLINYITSNVDKVVNVGFYNKTGNSEYEIDFASGNQNPLHDKFNLNLTNTIFKRCFLDNTNKYLIFEFIGFSNEWRGTDNNNSNYHVNFFLPLNLYGIIDIGNNYSRYLIATDKYHENGDVDFNGEKIRFSSDGGQRSISLDDGKNKILILSSDYKQIKLKEEYTLKIKYKNVEEIVD